MKNTLYILLILTLFSCRLRSKLTESTQQTTEKSDSTYYTKVVSIDTVTIPADTLRIEVPIEVLKRDTTIVYKNGRASTKIIYRDGVIRLDTRCDSLTELVLSTQEKLVAVHKRNQELIQSKEEVIIKPVRWYYKAGLWFSLAAIAFLLITQFINKSK